METGLIIVALDGSERANLRLADAFREATANRIAVLGTAYQPAEGWSRQAASAQPDILSGPVMPGGFRDAWGWAYYLCEYAHVCSRPRSLQARHIVAGNAVYRRSAVDPAWFASARSEIEYHDRMLAAGLTASWSDNLAVRLTSAPSFSQYIAQRHRRGRDWAAGGDRSLVARVARVGVIPLLIFQTFRAAAPRWPLQWLRALPWIVAAGAARAWCDATISPHRK